MKLSVLDHGFVELVDRLGDDKRIVEAARVSTGAGLKDEARDRKLISYLWRNGHTSPFEQVVFTFRIKLPIFVMRQLVRHRTARINEISGRYAELGCDFYTPRLWRKQDPTNKQGSFAEIEHQWDGHVYYKSAMEDAVNAYKGLLRVGVAREQARMVLPVSIYTECMWQMDLHNLIKFLRQRLHPHAQEEMREYARAIAKLALPEVPWTLDALRETDEWAKEIG